MQTDEYNEEQEDYEETANNKNSGNGDLIKKILLVVLVIVVIVLLYIAFGSSGSDNKPGNNGGNEVTLSLITSELTVNVGKTGDILFTITPATEQVTFKSSDSNVVMVDSSGKVVGLSEGVANITLSYNSNGATQEKICVVTVSKGENNPSDDPVQNTGVLPEINLSLANAQEGVWSKNDVLINVYATSQVGNAAIKYATNCEGDNCNYLNVFNNQVMISNNGTTKVTFTATDSNGTTSKSVTVMIDKNPPKVTLEPNQDNFVSDKDIKVCGKCVDEESGCTEAELCKTFTKSESNQTFSFEDKAGNKATTEAFTVAVDKNPPSCKLSASGTTVTAKVSENAVAYGFDKVFNNETSGTFSVSNPENTKGAISTRRVKFYVKNSIGTVAECGITLVKTRICRWECNGTCYLNRGAIYKESKSYSSSPSGVSRKVDASYCGGSDPCYEVTVKEKVLEGYACEKNSYGFWNPGLDVSLTSQSAS